MSRVKRWRQALESFPCETLIHGRETITKEKDDAELVLASNETIRDEKYIPVEQAMEEAYRNEIVALEQACQQHKEELLHLQKIHDEQKRIELEFDLVYNAIAEEQNVLELEARAFDNGQEQLFRSLLNIQSEMERLSSPNIRLPAKLVHLLVDTDRGLRYPLINQLRLAYRPKGDVHWKEIQAAWALAAQLLLSIGTLFQFQSQSWKLVPLSHCAKLFYHVPIRTNNDHQVDESQSSGPGRRSIQPSRQQSIVFNLGHPRTHQSKALLTWNALLCQVIQHVQSEMNTATDLGIVDTNSIRSLPFEITPITIGHTSLTQLDEDDDGGWSQVIHCMASNLLWLSDCASTYIHQQIVLDVGGS